MNSRKNPGATFYRLMAHAERGFIELALAAAKWNRTVAARELGISYRGLLYKIKKHGLEKNGMEKPTAPGQAGVDRDSLRQAQGKLSARPSAQLRAGSAERALSE